MAVRTGETLFTTATIHSITASPPRRQSGNYESIGSVKQPGTAVIELSPGSNGTAHVGVEEIPGQPSVPATPDRSTSHWGYKSLVA